MDILDKIAAEKRLEVEELKLLFPVEELRAPRSWKARSFAGALSNRETINIIAEIKKGSPSRGIIKSDFNPIVLARQYREGGAAALSVLTDEKHFYGRFEHMMMARKESGLPVLCKDFIIDAYQVHYARHKGADAILLIVKLLSARKLTRLHKIATEIGLDCLVEIHDEDELEIALKSEAKIIGVNNRNLRDFSVTLDASEQLAEKIPDDVIRVAESGIVTASDTARLKAKGYNNFLVGEALVRAENPSEHLRSLISV